MLNLLRMISNFDTMKKIQMITKPVLIALYFLILVTTACAGTNETLTINWGDGDSGKINGQEFRLANVDAPETGNLNSRNGAKCELERKLGYQAKSFSQAFTKGTKIEITHRYGIDRYERIIIDLSADGADITQAGLRAGHFKRWPHKGGRALTAKPDWCSG